MMVTRVYIGEIFLGKMDSLDLECIKTKFFCGSRSPG